MRGRISNKWSKSLEAYYQTLQEHSSSDGQAQSQKRASTWTRKLILSIWEYSISLWKHRNTFYHGHTQQEHYQKIRQQLAAKVVQAYQEAGTFNISDRHIFSTSIEERLKQPNATLQAWLDTFAAIRQNHHIQGIRETEQLQRSMMHFINQHCSRRPRVRLRSSTHASSNNSSLSPLGPKVI